MLVYSVAFSVTTQNQSTSAPHLMAVVALKAYLGAAQESTESYSDSVANLQNPHRLSADVFDNNYNAFRYPDSKRTMEGCDSTIGACRSPFRFGFAQSQTSQYTVRAFHARSSDSDEEFEESESSNLCTMCQRRPPPGLMWVQCDNGIKCPVTSNGWHEISTSTLPSNIDSIKWFCSSCLQKKRKSTTKELSGKGRTEKRKVATLSKGDESGAKMTSPKKHKTPSIVLNASPARIGDVFTIVLMRKEEKRDAQKIQAQFNSSLEKPGAGVLEHFVGESYKRCFQIEEPAGIHSTILYSSKLTKTGTTLVKAGKNWHNGFNQDDVSTSLNTGYVRIITTFNEPSVLWILDGDTAYPSYQPKFSHRFIRFDCVYADSEFKSLGKEFNNFRVSSQLTKLKYDRYKSSITSGYLGTNFITIDSVLRAEKSGNRKNIPIPVSSYNDPSIYSSGHLKDLGFMLFKLDDEDIMELSDAQTIHEKLPADSWTVTDGINTCESGTAMTKNGKETQELLLWREKVDSLIRKINFEQGLGSSPSTFHHSGLRSQFLASRNYQINAQELHTDYPSNHKMHASDEKRLFHTCMLTFNTDAKLLVQPGSHIEAAADKMTVHDTRIVTIPSWHFLLFHGYLTHAGFRYTGNMPNLTHFRDLIMTSAVESSSRIQHITRILDYLWCYFTDEEVYGG